MNHSFFNHYLERVQRYAVSEELLDAIQYIQSLKNDHQTDPVLGAFLKAELAFYHKNYHEALKYYLEARHIPFFHFFCYRASAYLSLEALHHHKAIKFIKKALRIKSDDYPSLKLVYHLYMIDDKHEKVQIVKNKIAHIKNHHEQKSTPQSFSLGEQEFDEFNQIMAKSENDSEMLFSQEFEEFKSIFTINLSSYKDTSILKKIGAYKSRAPLTADFALFFEGFNCAHNVQANFAATSITKTQPEHNGGYFIYWKGCGIAINPGKYFLENLMYHQLFLQDIHAVIITHERPLSDAECERIWRLNRSIEMHEKCERKVTYYINRAALSYLPQIEHSDDSTTGQIVLALDLPMGGDVTSSIQINEHITLNYFSCSLAKDYTMQPVAHSFLGIELILKGEEPLRIGYLSQLPWSPYLSKYLCDCQLLIAGLGKIETDDLNNETYNQDSLGYGGIKKLIRELKTDLVLCSEYDLPNNQLLQKVIRDLRKESSTKTTVLPVNTGLYIDLPSIRILSSDNQQMLKPPEVKMICLEETTSSIRYCSIKNIL